MAPKGRDLRVALRGLPRLDDDAEQDVRTAVEIVGPQSEMMLVSRERVFFIRVGSGACPLSIAVTVADDDGAEWTFEQPGWRPLAVGSGSSGTYVWSAREVVELPASVGSSPGVSITVDEDLLGAFQDAEGWVLVCETSVRRVMGGHEVARVELGGVIRSFRWTAVRTLALRADDGSEHEVVVRGRDLLV